MGDLDIARGATVDISGGKISRVRVFEGYPRAYKTREVSAGDNLMLDQANADMFRLATAVAMTADANFGSGTVSVVADFERGSLWSWKSAVPVNGSRWYDRAVSQDTYGQEPVYTEGTAEELPCTPRRPCGLSNAWTCPATAMRLKTSRSLMTLTNQGRGGLSERRLR